MNKPIPTKGNPTVLTVLRSGCSITFSDEDSSYLKGFPKTGYIEVGNQFGSLGLWNLDRVGTDNALRDLAQERERGKREGLA